MYVMENWQLSYLPCSLHRASLRSFSFKVQIAHTSEIQTI